MLLPLLVIFAVLFILFRTSGSVSAGGESASSVLNVDVPVRSEWIEQSAVERAFVERDEALIFKLTGQTWEQVQQNELTAAAAVEGYKVNEANFIEMQAAADLIVATAAANVPLVVSRPELVDSDPLIKVPLKTFVTSKGLQHLISSLNNSGVFWRRIGELEIEVRQSDSVKMVEYLAAYAVRESGIGVHGLSIR